MLWFRCYGLSVRNRLGAVATFLQLLVALSHFTEETSVSVTPSRLQRDVMEHSGQSISVNSLGVEIFRATAIWASKGVGEITSTVQWKGAPAVARASFRMFMEKTLDSVDSKAIEVRVFLLTASIVTTPFLLGCSYSFFEALQPDKDVSPLQGRRPQRENSGTASSTRPGLFVIDWTVYRMHKLPLQNSCFTERTIIIQETWLKIKEGSLQPWQALTHRLYSTSTPH